MLRAAVVGAGTAGIATAAYLSRLGFQVDIYEKAPELRPVGAGMLLQPTGLSVLGELGALDDVLDHGAHIASLDGVNTKGFPVVDLKYRRLYPQAFGVGIQRTTLCSALLAVVRDDPRVRLRLGVSVRGYESLSEDKVSIRIDDRPAEPVDLLVVSSGTRSAELRPPALVRRDSMYPWGALWTLVPDRQRRFPDVLEQVYRDTRVMLGLLPSGSTLRHGASSAHPDDALPHVSIFWSVKASQLRPDQLTSHEALADWKDAVRRIGPPGTDALLDEVREPSQLLYARYADVRMEQTCAGRVVFMGDASHATSPQLGQGCNFALIDSSVLHRVLGRAAASRVAGSASDRSQALAAAIPALLREYSIERKRHVGFYQLASHVLTPLFQSSAGLPLSVFRDLFMGLGGKVWPFSTWATQLFTGYKAGLFSNMPYPDPALLDAVAKWRAARA